MTTYFKTWRKTSFLEFSGEKYVVWADTSGSLKILWKKKFKKSCWRCISNQQKESFHAAALPNRARKKWDTASKKDNSRFIWKNWFSDKCDTSSLNYDNKVFSCRSRCWPGTWAIKTDWHSSNHLAFVCFLKTDN